MSGNIFLVTGASSGIGRAVARELAGRDCRVVAVARSADRLDELAGEWPLRIAAVPADLASAEGIASVAAELEAEGEIAGIVHSAGSLVPVEPYAALDPAELVEHFRIHVAVPIELYQVLAVRHPIRRLLFIDSYSSSTPRPGWPAYSTIKAAAQMAARCAAGELDETQVIRVFPGAVNTQIVDAVLASGTPTAAAFAAMAERGEFAEPAEAAEFIAAVLVDASDELLGTREVWDYNDPKDRSAAG